MSKWFLGLIAAALAGCASAREAAPLADSADPALIKVMVIGAFHMDNPGRDVANAEIDDMLTPQRQKEIAAAVAALAEFHPTMIALERIAAAPAYADPVFETFTPEDLKTNRDERYQLAYRLAETAGVSRVYGIDEQPDEGEPDYFPFDKLMAHAEKTGQMDAANAMIGEAQEMAARFSAAQKDMSVAQMLLVSNEGELASPEFYYRLFQFDRGEAQPGAELQAYWFMRNAKIFSKLAQVAKPGDRVAVVYGAGHKFWLDHFVEETPGFVSVDPAPYLEKAAK